MRDIDHSKAWEQYNNNFKNVDKPRNEHFPNTNKQSTPYQEKMTATKIKKEAIPPPLPTTTHSTSFVSPKTMLQKIKQENAANAKPKKNDGREWERLRSKDTAKIYSRSARPPGMLKSTTATKITTRRSQREMAKGGNTTLDSSTQTHESSLSFANQVMSSVSTSSHSDIEEVRPDRDDISIPLSREAKRLSSLEREKDRLRGQYLRFDIPDGLDDVIQRFIVAVTLRYKLHDDPWDSSVHGDFAFGSSYHPSDRSKMKEYHSQCRDHAEPLIRQLHGHGIVFIRQLLPVNRMISMFSSLGLPVGFIALCRSMLVVVSRMTRNGGGVENCFSRKYLMRMTRELVNNEDGISFGVKATSEEEEKMKNGHYLKLVSFLGEWGDVGGDELEVEEDLGLWSRNRSRNRSTNDGEDESKDAGLSAETVKDGAVGASQLQTQGEDARAMVTSRSVSTIGSLSEKTKTKYKSWVIPYTKRILAENESKNYGPYRHEPLIADNGDE